jgi:hypothetical protein
MATTKIIVTGYTITDANFNILFSHDMGATIKEYNTSIPLSGITKSNLNSLILSAINSYIGTKSIVVDEVYIINYS